MKSKISILIVILTLTVLSCKENDITYDTNEEKELNAWQIDAPAVKIHAPLYESIDKNVDLGDEAELLFFNDGLLYVKYLHSEIIEWDKEISIDDVHEMREYDYTGLWDNSVSGVFTIEDEVDTHTIYIPTSSSDPETYVSSADLTGGELKISINQSSLSGVSVWVAKIDIPKLTKNGVPYTHTFKSADPPPYENATNLDGYTIKTANQELEMICTYSLTASSELTGSLNVYFDITDVEYDFLEGYFGKMEDYSHNGEMEFDFFKDLEFEGIIGIRDISMEANITNNAGIPFNINADVYFSDDMTNQIATIDTDVDAATKDNQNNPIPEIKTVQADVNDEIEFNFDNHDYTLLIFDFIGKGNDKNPPPKSGGKENFLKKGDLGNLDVTINVPFHLKVSKYSRIDSIDFDYKDIIGEDHTLSSSVKKVELFFDITNNLPFAVELKVIAINEAGSEVHLGDLEIAAEKDNLQKRSILISEHQIGQLWDQEAKNIIFKTTAATRNQEYVKVTKDDYLDIDVKFSIKSNIPFKIF